MAIYKAIRSQLNPKIFHYNCINGDNRASADLGSNLFEEGLQSSIARLFHFRVYVSAKFGHHVKHSPVVVHETAAELACMLRKEFQSSCREAHTDKHKFSGLIVTVSNVNVYLKQSATLLFTHS